MAEHSDVSATRDYVVSVVLCKSPFYSSVSFAPAILTKSVLIAKVSIVALCCRNFVVVSL
jgi:hypothetical protein